MGGASISEITKISKLSLPRELGQLFYISLQLAFTFTNMVLLQPSYSIIYKEPSQTLHICQGHIAKLKPPGYKICEVSRLTKPICIYPKAQDVNLMVLFCRILHINFS